MRQLLTLVVLVAIPSASPANDITALFPDSTTIALGIDIKEIMNSPLGKKLVGNDNPFDASRKLLHALMPDQYQRLLLAEDEKGKVMAAVVNRLERVTIVHTDRDRLIYLEGEIDEDDYLRAAQQIAKDSYLKFKTEMLGERKLMIHGWDTGGPTYGVRLSKSLFVIVFRDRKLLTEVLDKHDGKKKAAIDKLLADRLKKVKPADTPIWLVAGELKLPPEIKSYNSLSGLVATISLKADADIRIVIECASEKQAEEATDVLRAFGELIRAFQMVEEKVWKAADMRLKRDGKTVTATGSVSADLLAELYTRQK